jgi:hypothetical protein
MRVVKQTIYLMQLGNLLVVATATNEAEVCLIEIRRTGQSGAGAVGEGMPVQVVYDGADERAEEEKDG